MILMEFEKKSFVRTAQFQETRKKIVSYVLGFSKVRSEHQKFCVRIFILIVRSIRTTILSKKSRAPIDQIVVA